MFQLSRPTRVYSGGVGHFKRSTARGWLGHGGRSLVLLPHASPHQWDPVSSLRKRKSENVLGSVARRKSSLGHGQVSPAPKTRRGQPRVEGELADRRGKKTRRRTQDRRGRGVRVGRVGHLHLWTRTKVLLWPV